ncbi:MAG: hypothetical protein ACYC4R_04910 [Anaerolineae bacterium]
MVKDLTEKVQASRSKFEDLVAKVPGYAGYKQKEERREADKLLRMHVARQYRGQLSRLDALQYSLTSKGNLTGMSALEPARTGLQLFIDRLETASYGYAGLFDAVKVDQAALDRLYDFDMALLDGVAKLDATLSNLNEAAASDSFTSSHAEGLVSQVDELNAAFGRRQDVLLA